MPATGGRKQFEKEEIPKEELYTLIWEVLGINKTRVHEFFGAAEHPVLYCSCKNHHFHIPAYARVLIRDTETLEALPKGRAGLVNLLTPIGSDLPLMSVMTDDIGVLHDKKECGCGIKSDYLEILGRTDMRRRSGGLLAGNITSGKIAENRAVQAANSPVVYKIK